MTDNPKDVLGTAKVPVVSVVPTAGLIHMANAMRYGAFEAPRADGRRGYGPFNWREAPIRASVYLDAIGRHALDWWDGEDLAADSFAHHFGHIMACAAIALDAIECGTFVDDRPPKGKAPELLERLKRKIDAERTAVEVECNCHVRERP